MGNNNTNTKLFIEAVLADMGGLSKELRKNLESVDTDLPLKFDSKELEEGVLGALREAFRGLESSRFASQLDLSEFISAIFKQLQQGTVTNDKADFVYAFADSVKIFESFAERFGGDAKVVSQTIRELNESLTAQGIQDYLTNLKSVYQFVDNLELKSKDKDRLLASFTSSLGVGVDANGLGDALGLKKVLEDDAEKYKDVTKFAVSVKEARKRLIELLGGTDDFKGWNDLLPGTKSRSDTARTRDIAGFISRIEALSGKEITAYLQDKINDAETDTTTRAQLEHLQKLYTEKGGWGEYYLKWSEKDNAGLQALTQNNNLIVEMTKRQLEERQKVFEKYGKYNSSLLTKGQSPQATIEYDTKTEAAQVNEELTIEEQTRRQIADQINQEAEELKKKLNVLKEIAELQKQVVNSGVEATPEYQEMQYLQDVLDDVTLAVNNKTKAFEDERGVVHSVAKAEVKDLQSIQDKLLEIAGFENEEDKMGKMSKPRQDLKELTEEQRKQAEEAQRAAEEVARTRAKDVRKGTVLGQLRREQEQEGEKSKDKPKSGATLKKQNLPSAGSSNKTSEKTANEREAQALKDINANAESAAAGLKKFGDTNSEIAQNVTTVAEALKKEASALNSITKALLKTEDSKIFQDSHKDKLQTALSETRDNIALSQKEVEALQKSTDIKIFNNDHLEEASSQLRSAYKDVATFKDIYSKDVSHENMIEMTKREIKLWKAYKEAEKQGIADSNLEAKRLNPANFGIDSNKNADNIKTLRDEIESKKQIYENYVRQAENIRKELEVIENPPTQKNLEKKDATIKDYQEAIGIIKEYIQAQMELAKVQEASSSESIEAKFNPEQLEQFVTTLGTISETLNKIQTASESFGKNIDFSTVIEQLESINNILSTFMGNITFDDFKDIFTVTIDEAADKIDDFKNALNLETTASRFEGQISQIQKKIEEFQTQLAQRNAKSEDNSLLIEQKETMGIVKEYIQAQQVLAEMQQKITPEATQVFFTPEQLEQFNTTIQSIIDATGKIETALGNLDKKVDLFPILEQLQSLNNILSNFINNISFDEFTVVFAFAIDKMINKINEFKTALNLDDVTAKYELQISQLQEKSKDLQNQLSEIKSSDNKSVEAIFNSEQLEQFSTALINISDSLNKIQASLGTLDDNSDIPSIVQSVKNMFDVFQKLELLIDDINNKKIKFGFSSNPNEKLIGEMNSEDVRNSLATLFDDAIKKLQEFKTNVDMSETVKSFKKQMAEMEKAAKQQAAEMEKTTKQQTKQIERLEQALEKEKKAREDDKAKAKAKEDKRIQEEARKREEKARQQALAREKAEQERQRKEEEALRKKQEEEEKQRIKEEQEVQERLLREEEQRRKQEEHNKLIAIQKAKEESEKLVEQDRRYQAEKIKQQEEQSKKQIYTQLEQNRLADQTPDYLKAQQKQKELQKLQESQRQELQENQRLLAEQGRALQLDEQKRQEEQNKKQVEQNKKNIQYELEQARLLEQAQNTHAKLQQEQIKEYEKQLYAWGEEDQPEGQLSFLSVIDQNAHDLDTEYKELVKEEQEHAQKVVEEEAKKASPILLPLETQISFTTNEDINRISKSMERDLFDDKAIQKIKDQYASLVTSDKYINSELNIEKILHPFEEQFTKKGINTKNYSELTAVGEEIKKVKAELASSFDSEGNIIGDPLRVKELLEQYNNLIIRVKELKVTIQSPTSEENVALQMAKDADKAKKELEKLKKEVDEFFENRKNTIVEKTAENIISTYGTTNEEGMLVPVQSSFFNNNLDYENLIEQQGYVIALSDALNEYKISVENLKKVQESDIIKIEDLKEANNQVELLENKIKQLETIIKKVGKGNTNATSKNINDLRTKIQSILENNSNLPEDATERLKDYLAELESGASISKAAYDSMTADIKQFSVEQKKSFSIWDMMTMKIKEGIAFLATKFSFYQIFNQFRQGVQVIRQFDDALTEMMKVSDESRKTLEAYQKTTFDTADTIGSNALQIQNSTADFMRLGESLTEAAKSAKTANVLMNVSEFQSIDEATKSLIAMSAAYDDLSKAQIIDKLNEVGNNYSISTSGAAEALQASASALKTAGNDMDEALALVTAGNQIVQDVAKAGNGLRTIALRLTGTKSAKEELEEMGEDTDSLITTQSKLRDTIKEATAVASNQFKGFDILDDNGNYKSTYEIMLGIAQIYQEIVDTDKELGRNNANLLLETVAGKTRANIAASIFQSPDVLKAAYESSQNADNSAMKENDKYLESISGHLSQLTNQWQEMWANAANREIINYFIDLGKALLQVIDFFGVLPSTIVGAMVYFNLIKRAAEDKSIIKGIGTWIKSLAEAEGAAGGLATELVSAGSAMKKAFGTVIPILGGVGTAIGLVLLTVHAVAEHQKQVQKELVDSVRNTNEEWKNQKQTLSDYASQYEELKTKLDTGNLSEQETLETKQQIYDIQKQITDQYGENVGKIDLINGKLKEQLNIISGISEAEANRIWNSAEYQKGFEIAKKAMTTESDYSLSQAFDINNIKTDEDKALSELVKQYTESRKPSRHSKTLSPYRVVSGTPIEAEEKINELIEQIEKLQEQNPDNEKFQKRAKEVISYLNTHIDTITKIREDNEASYFEGLPIELIATRGAEDYQIYTDYQSAVSNLESAYASGDIKQIRKAREAYEEATKAKNEFLKIPNNTEFSLLFDNINTSLIDTKNRFRDTVELFKSIPEPDQKESLFEGADKKTLKDNAKARNKLTKEQKKAYNAAKKLYDLNPDKVDIQATLDDNTYASGKYADALNDLMNAMGWTTADADTMINALITARIVHGDAADIANIASDSYNAFSSSVEGAITSLNSLNTALSESAKGTGLTEQTLTELRSAFGDNLNSVLERTANGYHLNTEGAYLLRQQQEAMVNADYASAMYEQYSALEKLRESYLKAKEAGEDTSGFVQQRQAIQNNIDKLNEQLMAFNNANSAYQTWLAKQSSEGEREMYNSVYSGYDAVKDELERGWAGEKTRSWLDLIFNDEGDEDFDAWTSSAEKVKEKFDEVTKDIKGTGGFSIADFFTVDANGKTTSQGVWNFFEAIENKQKEVGKEFVNLEEGWFDFTKNGDYQIADMLGMDIESVHAVLRAAADAGFEIHLDQPLFSLEQLEEKAYSAKDALEEATGAKLKINLDTQSEAEVDSAMQKLVEYQQTLSQDTSIDPNIRTERLQQVADLMNFLAAKKREFVEGEVFDLKILNSKELEQSKKTINDISNTLSAISKESGNTEFSKQFAIDPMLLNNVDYLQEKIDTLKEIRPNVDDSQVQYLDQLLAQLQYRVNLLNETDISGGTITVDQFMAAEQVVNDINTKLDYAAQHKDIQFNWDADESFIQNLQLLTQLPDSVKTEFGIDPNASAEELLELAKSGELHLEVKTSGDVPKDTQTTQKVDTYETTHKSEEVTLGVTTIGTEFAKEEMQTLAGYDGQTFETTVQANTEQANADLDETLTKADEVEGTQPETKVKADNSQANNAIDESTRKIYSYDGTTGWGYIRVDTGDTESTVSRIAKAIRDIPSYKSTTIETIEKTTRVGANGTAHAQGTAFVKGSAYAGGKWALPKNQTALTGELGTEIIVRDGNWFTVGDDGAEFVNLKKGDIVFNHKQSEELLENGYVTSNKGRGHLVGFANGTAYSSGSSSGAIKPKSSSSGMGGKSSSKSSGGSGRSSGGSGGGNNSSSKDAKETKNTLDEVEILIARIEQYISYLDSVIGNTYTTWSVRNNIIIKQLKQVETEIKDQQKAYTTYLNKANSVGLSSAWKQKVQSGAFRIEDVKDSDLWDKINEYKQWYEKALEAKYKVFELTIKEGELYKQRFDNEQTYYEEIIADTQHAIDLIEAFNDQLSEAGRLGSVINVQQQITLEEKRLKQLTNEYNSLIKQRDNAVSSGKILRGSEAWYEMQQSINEVSESIAEANTNLITFANNIRDINFDRWEKIHDAIDGVVNELEFFYDMLNSDEMFDEQGTITNQGVTGFALLAQEYDTYFKEVQRYQDEINETNRLLSKAEYDQNLVDKLKELKEAQQDAAASAKKTKESMIDLTEEGIKKQIDYVKKLIEDYEDLLEAQKDQTDYAKKVADQQKEINKLEKQYRAIQNDDSEEGATKRQQLRDQINEKRQELQETQEDRRLSETKDILGDFEEKFEEFLENKLKNIEGIVQEVINATNENKNVIKDTINDVANSYGYTPSDTLKAAIDNMSNNLVSYFNGNFENPQVTSIAEGVDAIVKYFTSAQKDSEQVAKNRMMAEKVKQTGTHIQTYTDDNGNTRTGYFKDDGSLYENYTGWAAKDGKTYRFNNGELMKGSQWVTVGGKKYYLDANGSKTTNTWKQIGGKLYHFNQNGEMQTGLATINGKQFYFDENGVNQKGLQTINGKNYYFDTTNGIMLKNGWRQVNGNLYHFNQNGEAQTGLYSVNGKQFYFDKNGVSQKGLQTINGTKYYFDNNGLMIKDAWRQVGDGLYHFGKDGKAAKGWMKTDSGKWFFFDPKTSKRIVSQWIHNNAVTTKPTKGDYYVGADGVRVVNGKRKTNKGYMTFDANGKWKGYKTGTKGVTRNDLYWTNEGNKPEAIIRKSDGAILTPLSKGDSVIPNSAMKNMYQALTDPAKYLKQYTTPDIKVVQSNNNNSNNQPPVVNMQFIANGVQDANKFVNDLMNNKKLEKWVQEVTLGQANGNSNFKKYSYAIR